MENVQSGDCLLNQLHGGVKLIKNDGQRNGGGVYNA